MQLRLLTFSVCLIAFSAVAAPPDAPPATTQLRPADSPQTESLPVPLTAVSPLAEGVGSNCKIERGGSVFCAASTPPGMFIDVHPHAPTVTFDLDVWLSECGLPGVKYHTAASVSQESRRYTTYRFNQASVVHWTWRPIKPCWEARLLNCKVNGQPRQCAQILDIRAIVLQ